MPTSAKVSCGGILPCRHSAYLVYCMLVMLLCSWVIRLNYAVVVVLVLKLEEHCFTDIAYVVCDGNMEYKCFIFFILLCFGTNICPLFVMKMCAFFLVMFVRVYTVYAWCEM